MAYGRRRVTYIPNRQLYQDHYRVVGPSGLPVFHGVYQDGSGLLSNIFRAALPILKSSAISAGKTLLSSGAKAFSDVVAGRDIKSTVTHRGMEGIKEVGRDIATRTANALSRQHRGGRAIGGGGGASKSRVRKRKPKQQSSDIFYDSRGAAGGTTTVVKRRKKACKL